MTATRDNCFTFLRYLFALCIFCGHLCNTLGEDLFICTGGIFVCGFFAISGFLNFNSYQQTPNVRMFAKKRFKRIYPAYSLTIIICALVGGCISTLSLSDYVTSPETWKYLFYNLLFLNYLQPHLPGVFDSNVLTAVNGALWTMKVEVLFYISVPLVYKMIQKYGKNKVLWSIVICSLLCNYSMRLAEYLTGNSIFYTLIHQIPCELVYFYTPALMLHNWEWVKKHGKTLMWITLLLLIPYFFDERFCWLHPLIIPILVITAGYEAKWLLPTSKWKDFSYEFYLFHFPVLQTIIFMGWASTQWSVALIALPLIFALAIPLHFVSKKISDMIR